MKQAFFGGPRLFVTIFGSVGLLLLTIAALFVATTLQQKQIAEQRIAAISSPSAAQLNDGLTGREVLLEGRISQRMQPQYQDLVAFYETYYVPGEDGDELRYGEDIRPVLLVELPDGLIKVLPPYQIKVAPTSDPLAPEYQRSYYYGVRAGENVIIGGIVGHDSELPVLEQATVLNPPREQYFDQIRGAASDGWIIVFICGGLGLVFGGFATAFWFAFAKDNTSF